MNGFLKNFGSGKCELFIRKYNHKVWTDNPAEMSSVWVEGSVAVPDVSEIKAKIAALQFEGREQAEDSKWGFNSVFFAFKSLMEQVQSGKALHALFHKDGSTFTRK